MPNLISKIILPAGATYDLKDGTLIAGSYIIISTNSSTGERSIGVDIATLEETMEYLGIASS